MKAITSNKQSDSVHSTFSSSSKRKNGESFFPSIGKSKSFFFGPATLQPKLEVGQPDDKYEQEADRVADAVMRMPDPQIQRKCKECEEEETLQKKSDGNAPSANHANSEISSQLSSRSGTGSRLPKAVQSEMSHKMGADFSGVNIHTDATSHKLNRQLRAKAFTHGSDIYFNRGQYHPGTSAGKHLLAHELTHVVQQKSSSVKLVQKSDFEVSGLPSDASSKPKRIFFTSGSATIPASEASKIATFSGADPSVDVRLRGTSSEEGSDAANRRIIQNRLQAVEDELANVGHTGTITKNVDLAAGEGQIEYRLMRSVEIIPAGATSSVPPTVSVVPCDDPHAGDGDYPAEYDDAHTEGERLITDGKSKLSGARDAATDAALNRFFGSSTDAKANEVSGELDDIKNQLNIYTDPANHQCKNFCSSTTASNTGTGGGAMMTICPVFFNKSLMERAATLIHESVHGTPSITGDDIAYRHHRLVEFLTPAQALQNPDTYRLFLLILDGQSPDVGPVHSDTLHSMSSSEENETKKAIAWLEMYLTRTYLQTKFLYEKVHSHRTAGTATWPAGFYKRMMAKAAPHFGLTAPPTVPGTEDDQVRLAAVFDRYRTMRDVFWSPVDVTKGASMSWSNGPGNTAEVDDAFFGLSPLEQVKILLEQLVGATPDISSSLEPHYVTFLDEVRQMVGAPDPPP